MKKAAIAVEGKWLSDKEVSACMWCKEKFTVVRRRHHCRVCGGIFCGKCTSEKLTLETLPGKAARKEQRVCTGCYAKAKGELVAAPEGDGQGVPQPDSKSAMSVASSTDAGDGVPPDGGEAAPLKEAPASPPAAVPPPSLSSLSSVLSLSPLVAASLPEAPQVDVSGAWQVKITLTEVQLSDEVLDEEYKRRLKEAAVTADDGTPDGSRPRLLSCEEYKANVRRSTLEHLMATQRNMLTSWTLEQEDGPSGIVKGTTATGASISGVTSGHRLQLEYNLPGQTGPILTEVVAKLYPGPANVALKGRYVTTASATGLVTVRSIIGSRPGAAQPPADLPTLDALSPEAATPPGPRGGADEPVDGDADAPATPAGAQETEMEPADAVEVEASDASPASEVEPSTVPDVGGRLAPPTTELEPSTTPTAAGAGPCSAPTVAEPSTSPAEAATAAEASTSPAPAPVEPPAADDVDAPAAQAPSSPSCSSAGDAAPVADVGAEAQAEGTP